ncbi:hypothetical protein ABVT39_020036 [Epinephelus coioides]
MLPKLSREAWLLHCQVSWTLDQVSVLRQESSGLLSLPTSVSRLCHKHGLWLLWIQSNLNEKKNEQQNFKKEEKKIKKISCDVFACGRCIPSASIDVAHLLITEV